METAAFTLLQVAAWGGYLAPTIIAAWRRSPGLGRIAMLNIVCGWSIIGFVLALDLACRPAPEARP